MSAPVLRGDQAVVSVFVAVPQADAFEVFTGEIDLWWRRGPRYRIAGKSPGSLHFEPRPGGRLFETVELPSGKRLFEVGTVTVWEPPARLVFEWRGVNFAPGEKTEVEVLFEGTETGTRVRLTHRGWSALRDDHPVRHGLTGAAFTRMIGMWWSDLLRSYMERAPESRSATAHPGRA